jgi:26S proteasome regulatory subunit N3
MCTPKVRPERSQDACSHYNYLTPDPTTKDALLYWIPASGGVAAMEIDSAGGAPAPQTTKSPQTIELVPESEIYIRLLLIHHLLASKDNYPNALKLANDTVEKIQSLNRRSLDPIAAKVWYAVERAYELSGQLADARP